MKSSPSRVPAGATPAIPSPRPLTIRSLDAHRTAVSTAQILRRIRAEFAEMRGFSPTLPQAARLFDLSPEQCGRLLTTLVLEGSLRQGDDGRFRLA